MGERMKLEQEKALKDEHQKRFLDQQFAMKKRRMEMADEVGRQFEVFTLSSEAWKLFLSQAHDWTCSCERLTKEWDMYEKKGDEIYVEFGERPGFVPRAIPYVGEPSDWKNHS